MAKSIHVKAKAPWKSVKLPKNTFEDNVFDGLIDIQELNDYEFIKGNTPILKKAKTKKRKATEDAEAASSKTQKTENDSPDKATDATVQKKKGRSRKKKIKPDGADGIDSNGNMVVNTGESKETSADNVEKEEIPTDANKSKKRKRAKRKKKNKTTSCDTASVEDVNNVNKGDSKDVPAIVSNENANETKEKKKKKNPKQKKNPEKPISISEESTPPAPGTPETVQNLPAADMSKWSNLFVPSVLLQSLQAQGFENPTTIQSLILPSAIRDHKDILAAAETGSGKTLAFGIPVLAKILSQKERSQRDAERNYGQLEEKDVDGDSNDDGKEDESGDMENEGASDEDASDEDASDEDADENEEDVSMDEVEESSEELDEEPRSQTPPMALILEPTRELAVQVHRHLTNLAKYTDLQFAIVVGGMSVEKQRRLLKRCPEVIVATPGRLWQLIEEDDDHLSQVDLIHCLVVDEADRMVEKGHYEELTRILQMINESPRRIKKRQSFVMSATLTMEMPIPRRVLNKVKEKDLEKDKLKMLSTRICVGTKPKIIDLTPKNKVAQTLTEMRINCSAEEKDIYLYYFLCQHPGRTLVFANSKDCLRRLVSVYNLLECNPYPLHADMQQRQRLKNLDRFSVDSRGLLLASDVAARGLDIPKVDYVLHYQVPQTMENYVHRSGRTARASNVGLSVMLVAPEDAKNYRKIVQGVKNGEELPIMPLDMDLIPAVKKRVELAKTIDVTEYRAKKVRLHNDFFTKAAEDMDMILDEKALIPETGDSVDQAQDKQRLKAMRQQLSAMLEGSLAPLHMTKYPTKSGQLLSMKSINLFDKK